MHFRVKILFVIFIGIVQLSVAQKFNWTADGLAFTRIKEGNIVRIDPKTDVETIIIKKELLTPAGSSIPLMTQSYEYSNNNAKILVFANTVKVWRYNTKGDYWLVDIAGNKLHQLGKSLPAQSLMFAKFSPDSKSVAYVSEHNIYAEDVSSGIIRRLTGDGTRKMINGTFDWVYEEEFGCRDGFRWSPDSKQIAFWQVNAAKT